MASMNHRQYTAHKYNTNYNDYEGLDYDDYDYGDYDKEYSLNHNQKDDWSGYDMPGRAKSKKQARKFARRGR